MWVNWASSHPRTGPQEKTEVHSNIVLRAQGSQSITPAYSLGRSIYPMQGLPKCKFAQMQGERTCVPPPQPWEECQGHLVRRAWGTRDSVVAIFGKYSLPH